MNSKGHLIVSLVKSGIRMWGAILSMIDNSVYPIAIFLLIAEVFGVVEELVDKR